MINGPDQIRAKMGVLRFNPLDWAITYAGPWAALTGAVTNAFSRVLGVDFAKAKWVDAQTVERAQRNQG